METAEMERWKALALRHWEKWQPNRVRALKAAKMLDKELSAAARMTHEEMQSWMKAGATHDEAWEATRNLHLFPPPESAARS